MSTEKADPMNLFSFVSNIRDGKVLTNDSFSFLVDTAIFPFDRDIARQDISNEVAKKTEFLKVLGELLILLYEFSKVNLVLHTS